jgi:predicted metal-dependent hydrolase
MGHKEINYEVKYRNIKYPRLEFKSGELELILPLDESPKDLIEKHRNWIVKKKNFIEECLKASNNKKLASRNDKEFREIVDKITVEISESLRVKVNRVLFRKMKTKWASCSPKKNLTINTLMRYLPRKLIEYIIYHELTHLIEKRHNERFWDIIEKKFKNFKDLEMSLFANWFLINSKKGLI